MQPEAFDERCTLAWLQTTAEFMLGVVIVTVSQSGVATLGLQD